jgi:hypothetical protein
MNKLTTILLAAGAGIVAVAGTMTGAFAGTPEAPAGINTAYDVTMTTIDGKPMPFSQYKGKVLLVVNTASFCGFTPQYEALEKAQTAYKDKGFTVIGVPSGDFMGQEYKTNAEIKQFCESKFGINFPLSESPAGTQRRSSRGQQRRWDRRKRRRGTSTNIWSIAAARSSPRSARRPSQIRPR